jgi:hypothetical protein
VTAGALVAGGLVAGVLGGAIVAGGGGGQPGTAGGQLAVYPCPDSGPPLVMVQAGQRLLATGRTEDSAWLRIHFPEPGRTEAWVQASPLQVEGSIDELPVAECAPEVGAAAASLEPLPTLTALLAAPPSSAPSANPSAAPSATPAPTETPNDRPVVTALSASPRTVSYDMDRYCPRAESTVTFRVKAEDDAGITGVTLFWREPDAGSYAQSTMSRTAGSARDGTWQVSLDTQTNGINRAGRLLYYAIATDSDRATRRVPGRGTESISVEVCRNEGPEITKVASSSGSKLSWDPLGSPANCQTATNITAVIKDVDGVKSATLFYRRPGASSWQSKPMDDDTIKGKWYANLDTLGDRITIPDPPTGTLRWYIRAVDDKGLDRRTDTRAMSIRRCDTEAQFGGSSIQPGGICAPINVFGSAEDPDGIGRTSAVLVYTYLRQDGTPVTKRKRMTGSQDGDPWYYRVTIQPESSWSDNRFSFSVHLETTDRFGGTSRGGDAKTIVPGC